MVVKQYKYEDHFSHSANYNLMFISHYPDADQIAR